MKSVFIYFVLFLIITIITYLSEVVYKKSKKASYFLSLVCVIILSLFAAFRDYSVGTDIGIYGLRIFNLCDRIDSFSKLLTMFSNERFYFILNYIVSRISSDFKVFLFVLEFITCSSFYFISYKVIKKNRWLFILAFLFLWYGTTFNILRQSLAIAIIIYGYQFLMEKKYSKYLICVAIACFFHTSAIIAIMCLIAKIISEKKNSVLYVLLATTGIISIYFMISGGVLKLPEILSKYSYYLTNISNMNYKFMTYKIIMLLVVTMFTKYIKKENEYKFLLIILLFDILFYSSTIVIRYGYRMSYYFLPHYPFLLTKTFNSLKDNKAKGTVFYLIVLLILLVMYWILRYVVIGYDGIYPFKFYWN